MSRKKFRVVQNLCGENLKSLRGKGKIENLKGRILFLNRKTHPHEVNFPSINL